MTRQDPAVPDSERACLEVRRLGRTGFEECYELQKKLVEERAADRIGDVLILTEHDPVVTLGRKTPSGAAAGVPPSKTAHRPLLTDISEVECNLVFQPDQHNSEPKGNSRQ